MNENAQLVGSSQLHSAESMMHFRDTAIDAVMMRLENRSLRRSFDVGLRADKKSPKRFVSNWSNGI